MAKGSIRMMVPIIGDTTLFSQSKNPALSEIEALPHKSIAIWHATQEGALHSAPPISEELRFSILFSIITKDCEYEYKVVANHPSIKEINQYSILNEISPPNTIESNYDSFSYVQKLLCDYIGIFCNTTELEL